MSSIRWPRQGNESDDAYFMRVWWAARDEYPELPKRLLYYGTCLETELPCVHPVSLLEYRGYPGPKPAREYWDEMPKNRLRNSECMARVHERIVCTVCDTWAPSDPVDICRLREERLMVILIHVTQDIPD